ncbi:T9SS type A sorting domain-containing protein [Hymenobacter sp. RP-2-7]|uniref:T9SS type A sorting domain-containing protein n=1 Tax=Hymenobacter polaris TaxID=2682546 RepID=A0A7Y0FNP6_9BACT|nr:T9SS type A sorting domain-containing protein [Hymenobacter polaris]NML66811.1 T9SS type A sorting domain-containing protein [Hymenobacter polaris]
MRFYPLLPGWLMGLLAGLLGATSAAAQLAPGLPAPAPLPCLLLPLGPAERVAAAPLIVEAQVLDAQGEWDAGHQRIFTRQHLRVFRVLKGALPDTAALPLLVEGGQVGLIRQELTNTLRPLPPGQQGIFFLMPAPWPGLASAWAAYASSQGVIAFDLAQNTAAEPTRPYASPAAALAQTIQLSGQPAQVLRPNPALAAAAQQAAARAAAAATQRTQAVAISGFSPSVTTAGTGAVLTIVGSGFGSSRGSGGVDFRNADDGGATTTRALAFDYLSWSDTRIQVRVPSLASDGHPAGTGLLRVTAADGSTADSATPLTIVYALTTINNTSSTFVDRPNHVATNGAGGLNFQLAPNFRANAAAVAAWQRALAQWRCRTGINWALGPDAAANTIALDQANVVAFDDGSLPARVLGRTSTYYSGCYNLQGEVVFYTQEIDQQFATSLTFQFGPALATAGQYDFESVATHELGHAQQLSHLIRPGAIMHYGIAAGANLRTLNPASDVAGGRLVLRTRSFRQRGCGGPAMLPAPLTSLGATTPGGATFPFSTRDECYVSGFVLERSAGPDTTAAAAGWQAVASTSAGQASGQYQLADPQPATGLRYYRLGVRRPDGTTDYAAPLPASADTATAGPQVFPNPLGANQLQLSYPAAAAGTLVLRLYDTVGRCCLAQAVSVQAGLNLLSLNAEGLLPGLYLLRFTASGQPSYTVRLLRL